MRIVLSEEEYIERLSSILKRDFFPSLLELENELSGPERLSLSTFQSTYTTEDNASFEELLERENARKRGKFERIFGGSAALVDDPSRRLLLQDSKKYSHEVRLQPEVLKTIENGTVRISTRVKNPTIKLENTRFPRRPTTLEVPLFDTSSASTSVDNNEYVPMTPQIDPESGDLTPIFTFGDVVSTPQRLNSTPTTSNKFRVPPTPVREAIAHSLSLSAKKKAAAEKMSSWSRPHTAEDFKKLNRTPTSTSTPVSKYSLQDLKGLTPKRTSPATESDSKPKMITKKK